MKSIQITVTGKLYKTGYRFFIKQLGNVFKISGDIAYSKNHRQVIINASGDEAKLEKFISLCRLGCPGSKIVHIRISESDGVVNKNKMEIINH